MKTYLSMILVCALFLNVKAQTTQMNLIQNGSFESTTHLANWSSTNTTYIHDYPCACTAKSGLYYAFFGDQSESSGVNSTSGDIYQSVNIPSTAANCSLYFYVSINTTETTTSNQNDLMNIVIRNSSGTLLNTLASMSNLNANYGIPGCQNWAGYYVVVPSTYFGTIIRISFEFLNDYSKPTIFKLDSISLLATIPCTYSLTPTSFTCANSSTGTYNNIATLTATTGCSWSANVTSGNSWLSSISSGIGSGSISITVLDNTSTSLRTGTITAGGQTFTITQPGKPLGIGNVNQKELISFYPNPAKNEITIESSAELFGNNFSVTDNLGRILIGGKLNESKFSISLDNLKSGIYFLRVESDAHVYKFFKNQ